MIAPGALVMLTPLVVGILFGTRTLSGILAGALVSGVQMAVSMSNTGGAWDNAKKYVEVSLHFPLRRHGALTFCPFSHMHCALSLMPPAEAEAHVLHPLGVSGNPGDWVGL